ncbi:hypothetical protein JCM4914_08780 [Streptomyces platensis subsp. malvinus]
MPKPLPARQHRCAPRWLLPAEGAHKLTAPRRYAGLADERTALRAVTDEIMYAILTLSGQEYVDLYATEAKARAQAEAHPQARRRRTAPRTPPDAA